MYPITFLPLLFFLIFSISCVEKVPKSPIIAVLQGVIDKENRLPISIFWYIPSFTQKDWFFVRVSNSEGTYTGNLTIESSSGIYELPRTALEHAGRTDRYCALAFLENGIPINNISCESKIQWMYDRRDLLEDQSLMNLVIPGTHHSAAYAEVDFQSLDEQSIISRWTRCQTQSIKSQLIDGIRYLDLRPSYLYRDAKKEYIVTHGILNLISMDEVVKQINEFMEISKDIVIVSFKEFRKGFSSDDDHRSFINYLEHSFKKHAHPRERWMYTLGEFWSANKRLILSYDHPSYEISDITWSPIDQWWSDVQTIHKLHSSLNYLYQAMKPLHSEPYAAMVELTHSFTTIVEDVIGSDMSLRHWAERVGRCIPQWYTEEWQNKANIIAVDFYQTSGIVDLAIQLTEQRLPH